MPSRTRLIDIAKKAKVSTMTVSRVIRGDPKVAAKTRERIQSIVEELNYRPDPMMRAFRAHRNPTGSSSNHGNLAFLMSHSKEEAFRRNPILRRYWESAQFHAQEMGYQIQIYQLDRHKEQQTSLDRVMYHRGVLGLLIGGVLGGDPHFQLEWSRYSVVALGFNLKKPKFHTVRDDHFRDMRLAFKQLIERGYRRIGFAVWQRSNQRDEHQWLAAYLLEQHELNPSERIPPLIYEDPELKETQMIKNWIHTQKPEVIISAHRNFLNTLPSINVHVPRDISFLSLGAAQGETGIAQDPSKIGAIGVELINNLIMKRQRGIPDTSRNVLIEGVWKEGNTLSR